MEGVETYLDAILDHHRTRAAGDARDLETLIETAMSCDEPRKFRNALHRGDRLGVISEIKRRSPSKGDLHPYRDARALAREYEAGGASCLSVLTDEPHFGGSARDLGCARAVTELPILRKDFTVDLRDVCDARIMGADCVLLIAAALDDAELSDFHALAGEIGLDALVEVHDEAEVERALAVGSNLVGVNQRDLVTFSVDQQRAVRVAASLPEGVVRVAESGVRDRVDAEALAAADYHAVLVGESLVTATEPRTAVAELRVPRSARRWS